MDRAEGEIVEGDVTGGGGGGGAEEDDEEPSGAVAEGMVLKGSKWRIDGTVRSNGSVGG